MIVIHIANPDKINPDYPRLLDTLEESFMSQADTLVVPAGNMVSAMELLLNPVIEHMMKRRDRSVKQSAA